MGRLNPRKRAGIGRIGAVFTVAAAPALGLKTAPGKLLDDLQKALLVTVDVDFIILLNASAAPGVGLILQAAPG